MTNHWRDIKNADLILINGANPAEAHPVGFQWFMRAKLDRGAKMIHADPRSVFQLMKNHYSRYTPEVVSSITGIPVADFNKVADLVGQMGKPDKVMTIVYAVGLTHHTTGGQLIRSGAVLQLLLGNMGRP